MASVISDPNGLKRIQFFNASGQRKTIRLGKVDRRQAETVYGYIEDLAAAQMTRSAPKPETALWVGEVDEVMYGKLAAAGLVAERASTTLGAFLDGYIDSRKVAAKSSTHLVYGHTRRCLLAHFGADKILRDITPGDADAFRLFLAGQGLADNTVRRRIGIARQFFNAAKRRKLIPENPFDGIAASVRANMARFRFVTRQEAQQVLAACPNAEWRLLLALSRFGGLRCHSEHLALRWQDVDWARNRIRIGSPKPAHHEGGAIRVIPRFWNCCRHCGRSSKPPSPARSS